MQRSENSACIGEFEPHSSTWSGEKGEKGVKYTIKYIRDLML